MLKQSRDSMSHPLFVTNEMVVSALSVYSSQKKLDSPFQGQDLHAAPTLASQSLVGHSWSFITIVIMTLGRGLFVGLVAQSCGLIWLPCFSSLCITSQHHRVNSMENSLLTTVYRWEGNFEYDHWSVAFIWVAVYYMFQFLCPAVSVLIIGHRFGYYTLE